MTLPDNLMIHPIPIDHLLDRTLERGAGLRSKSRFNTRAITSQMRKSPASYPYLVSSTLDQSRLAPVLPLRRTSEPVEIP